MGFRLVKNVEMTFKVTQG